MADRQWFAEGVLIFEDDQEREFVVEGVQVDESLSTTTPTGVSIAVLAARQNQVIGGGVL